MRLSLFLSLLLVATSLAGCLQDEGGKPAAGTGGAPPTSPGPPPPMTPPPNGNEPPLPNATLPRLHFEGCRGNIPALDFEPEARVMPYIPNAFEPRGFYPLMTQLNLALLKCERVVTTREVRTNVSLLWTFAQVEPRNGSWKNQSYLSLYAFDLLITDQAVVDALKQAGANAELANFHEVLTPLPSELMEAVWTFNNARVSFELRFHYPTNVEPVEEGVNLHMWYGANPYYRVDVVQKAKLYGVQGTDVGTLQMSGNSRFVEMVGVPIVPIGTAPFEGLRWDIPPTPQLFKSGGSSN